MADHKLLLKRGADEDFLSDSDPLAELARIVGFEPAAASRTATPAQRREPAFDLEDELLKELEVYEQPAPAVDMLARSPAFEPAAVEPSEPEQLLEPDHPVELDHPVETAPPQGLQAERPPVLLEAVETVAEASDGRVYERPASHPVFDLEDEILREFAAFDARRVASREQQPVDAEIITQDSSALNDVPVRLHDAPVSPAAEFASREDGREIYNSFLDDDLDAEISGAAARVPADAEVSVSDEDLVSPEPKGELHAAPSYVPDAYQPELFEEPAERAPHSSDAGYGDDLSAGDGDVVPSYTVSAEVNAPAVEVAAEPVAVEEPRIGGVTEPIAAEPAKIEPARDMSEQEAPAPGVVSEDASADSRNAVSQTAKHGYGLDDLLAEVDRYPVADGVSRWGVQSKPIALEEIERSLPPVVSDSVPAPVDNEVTPSSPVDVAASSAGDGDMDFSFDDGGFEIDIGEMELDLSDIHDSDFSVSADLLSEIADAPVAETAPEPEQQTSYLRPAPAAAKEDYSSLPFDPSQITLEDEVVEAIADMDVPDVPVTHDDAKPAPHPEYDIDLDAEMAHLFSAATAPAESEQRPAAQDNVVAFASAAAKPAQAPLDLDEFERALEEDFRRSFTESRADANRDRVPLAPAPVGPSGIRARRGGLLLAGAAVAVVLFGGAGVYAYMSGDTTILASSEPKVILADTSPVKVVPDDPGGKQVPNQNKAVYDRVSGEGVDELKQESLLTSNEEPVDVVQRTLEPENLPMDDDAMAAATPTGDTIDPRLLPDEAEQERVTTTSKVVSGVSPRKVKTMVVRPDGTLVEREVTEEDLRQQAANDAELTKIAENAARDAATATDSQADDIAKAIASVPERLAPADEVAAKPADSVEAKPAAVSEVDPNTPTAATSDDAVPLATADPVKSTSVETTQPAVAEQAADVAVEGVEKTDLKPAATAVDQKPADTVVAEELVERSIAVDEQAAATDENAIAKAADADVAEAPVEDAPVRKVKTTTITPVPENRPIDQPVTVVGTVTDQGTVRSDTEAKPQEVALADQSTEEKPATALPAGAYVIQIASLPSEAEAQSSYSRLSAKFAGIIGGRAVDIRKAQIKNKGTYYRVRILAGTKQEAQALCSEYKKAGGSCLVSK